MNSFQKICLVRRDNIGDLVCTTSAIKLLRLRFPEARIFALVNSYNADVLKGNPDLDRVYVYHKSRHSGGARLRAALSNLKVFREIRAERIDAAVGCSSAYSKNLAWYTFLTGARLRIGYVKKKTSRPSFYNVPLAQPAPDENLHEVEALIKLLAPLGVEGTPPPLDVRPDSAEVRGVLDFIGKGGFKGKEKLVAFHISSRKPQNRWPKESFRELAQMVQERFGVRLLLLWSPGNEDNPFHPGDDGKAEWILSRTKPGPLAYRTTKLGELIAAVSVCDMVVCSDGGAMHIAAGLGKPILTIWGATDPRRWAPWGVPYRLLQKSRVAADVSAADALAGFEELFKDVFPGESCSL